MAKENLKLQVGIEGDNKGFKRELTKTERELKGFEQRIQQGGGVSMGTLLGLGAVQAAPGAFKAAMARKALNNRAAIDASMDERMVMRQLRAGNDHLFKGQEDRISAMFEGRQKRRARRAQLWRDSQPLRDLKAAMPMIVASAGFASLVAGVSAAAVKVMGNQRAFDAKAARFSGSVQAAQARVEVSELRAQLQQSRDPGFIAQQRRKAQADSRWRMAGVQDGSSWWTEMEIFLKNRGAQVVDLVGNISRGGDFSNVGTVGPGMTYNPVENM